jgi:putative oxidoreductase
MQADVVARFLVTGFFAVVFLQSAVDKLTDRDGNISYFTDHFKGSPVPSAAVPLLFWLLTLLEGTAGVLCALGLLLGDFVGKGFGVSACGVSIGGVALLGLLAGQRLAKDYAGAAVIAAYFVVALIGLRCF